MEVDDNKTISVIDTSSIIQVRRIIQKKDQKMVFAALTKIVQQGRLVYPVEVVSELERYTNNDSANPDLPYVWAKNNKKAATANGSQFEQLRAILAHPQVRRIMDPDKTGIDEADPHVLALAMRLKETGYDVTVLTEEIKDRPDKLSMGTACGHLKLYRLPIEAFLVQEGLIP